MVEYKKVNVELSPLQLNRLGSAVKNQTEVTLKMNVKVFNGNNLPQFTLV